MNQAVVDQMQQAASTLTQQVAPEYAPLIDEIVQLEWDQFQRTVNQGGRASCQNNWPTFQQMRVSQFATWPRKVLESYLHDLHQAQATGGNLITEKYARMMASTDPVEYTRSIEPYMRPLGNQRIAQQERIIAQQVKWAREFMEQWPHLGAGMRVLTSAQDSREHTSFETYLRGELSTYSQRTLDYYEQFITNVRQTRRNITSEIITVTVRIAGFDTLVAAENAQIA